LLVGICASSISVLVFASPASAYFRDFYPFFVDSPLNSDSPKTLIENCPRDTAELQLGRGGFLTAGSNLGLTRLADQASDKGLVGAAELKPDDRKWHLNGQLFCVTRTGDPPAGSPAAAVYLKGVYTRRSESARNSDSPKEHRVRCFGRDVAIGGGFRIVRPPSGKEPRAVARGIQVFKSGGESGVRAVAHETKPSDLSWSLAPHAICANVTDFIDTKTYASSFMLRNPTDIIPRSSSTVKEGLATCPPGRVIIGGGVEIFGDGPLNAPPRGVMLTESRPFNNEWYARAVEIDSTDKKWGLQTRAVCASQTGPTLGT